MKKFMLCIFIVVLCMVSCGMNSVEYEDLKNMSNSLLTVNGTDITSDNYVFIEHEKQYAKIPLIAVLSELGVSVEWEGKRNAVIIHNGNLYDLNTAKNTLVKRGDSFNMIELPPGTNHGAYYQALDGEFLIDTDSAYYFLKALGITVTIDYDRSIVKIFIENN